VKPPRIVDADCTKKARPARGRRPGNLTSLAVDPERAKNRISPRRRTARTEVLARILPGPAHVEVRVTDALDTAAVRRWSRASVRSLESHRAEIDELNVFPIADMDTGTNMVFTFRAGNDALQSASCASAPEALKVLAKGAVLAARGNSGVLLAQLLSGLADAAVEAGCLDGRSLAEGLRRGAAQARAAVAEPVEGTILTVAREAADAVPAGTLSPADVASAAVDAAAKALVRTRDQLPILASAGVVDAGAQGYVLVLTALADVVGGEPALSSGASLASRRPRAVPAVAVPASSARYEVQFLLEAPQHDAARLRSQLDAIGDSVAVVGTGDGTWNVHAHVDDVGAAIEAGVAVGRSGRHRRPAGRPRRATPGRRRRRRSGTGSEPALRDRGCARAARAGALGRTGRRRGPGQRIPGGGAASERLIHSRRGRGRRR
jgi:hypothetical protein